MNQVTLYSNGIGHFSRQYTIQKEPKNISIPFKKEYISDVLASLQVSGRVKYTNPASFTPDEINPTISLDGTLFGLLKNLIGAKIKIGKDPSEYHLVGVENRQQCVDVSEPYMVPTIILEKDGSLKTFFLGGMTKDIDFDSIQFVDESVKLEISKALKNKFQSIKPDSTFLDISICSTTDKDEEATIQYAIPVASWQMRYSIHQRGNSFYLDGTAIIPNNTDEDWDNFIVRVVTGNPVSFSTDMALVNMPQRMHIDLINDQPKPIPANQPNSKRNKFTKSGINYIQTSDSVSKNSRNYGMQACSFEGGEPPEQAISNEIEVQEVGDFCIFKSNEPINILAKKTAIVPMFMKPLKSVINVLLFNHKFQPQRPYRAIKFKNETEYSLGTGKTTFYQDNIYSGEGILEATKPMESRMIPYCLENSVRVKREVDNPTNRMNAIKINDGICIQEEVRQAGTKYTITNLNFEDSCFVIEHQNVLSDPTYVIEGIEVQSKESMTDGVRIFFTLKSEKIDIIVKEVATESSSFAIHDVGWIRHNKIIGNTLLSDKNIQHCLSLQGELDNVNVALQTNNDKKTNLIDQSTRIRSNLEAIKSSMDEGAVASRKNWLVDLNGAESQIKEITSQILPDLQKQERELIQQLRNALLQISANWSA